MKILLANIPWQDEKNPRLRGVRAGSRWPHFQKIPEGKKLPRYLPFPFFMAIAAADCANNGHEVLLIDAVAEGMPLEEFHRKALDFNPGIVIAETSTPSLLSDMEYLKKFKSALPETKIVCAGAHSPDFGLRQMKKESFPDFWIAGEYDLSVSALASALENNATPDNVPGLMTKESCKVQCAYIEDLNKLPAPLFEQLPILNYSDPVCGLPSPGAQTWLSRGCPYKCSFCVWPQIIYGNRKYRTRNIDKTLEEIKFLIDKYNCESFYFDDDTTNIGEKRMKELSEKIIESGLNQYPWAMMARADCMSDSMLENLAKAGMYAVKYGVESVSEKLLNACDKGTDLKKFNRAIQKTKALGIKIHLTFTFGLPGETPETIKETMDFAMETAPESAQFSICSPFPGTKFYNECMENGWLSSNDWSHFAGSGEFAVVQTPELSAVKLQGAFHASLDRWNAFLSKRTEKRKKRLKNKIALRSESGEKWAFYGEKEFASFIMNDNKLKQTLAGESKADFAAIVSRHDEEKIFRRLLRNGKFAPENICRLYQDN